MVDFFYLADSEVHPCEIVEFAFEGETESEFHTGLKQSLYLRAEGESTRFLRGRLYIASTTSSAASPARHHQVGLFGEYLILVIPESEEVAKAGGRWPTYEISDGTSRGGFFFPSRDRAERACERIEQDSREEY